MTVDKDAARTLVRQLDSLIRLDAQRSISLVHRPNLRQCGRQIGVTPVLAPRTAEAGRSEQARI
jgi:hypothetical protein